MQSDIRATEAVRNFSELLNNIKYRGDRYTIIRGGKPAASLVPVELASPKCTLGDLREIIKNLPHIDRGDTAFGDDVLSAAASQPAMPEAMKWE